MMRERSQITLLPTSYGPTTAACAGFGLLELLVVIVIIGILASIAIQSMDVSLDDYRRAKTEREMEMLSRAIVGDPDLRSGGQRIDFGYVGDVGSFPPNLQALLQNPGGYSTWKGPYLPPSYVGDTVGFKYDEWGAAYVYSGGTSITSTGSGLVKKLADESTDYTLNTFQGLIIDSSHSPPGADLVDSVDILVVIPNGAGATITKTYHPDSTGEFTLDSLPVGCHPLNIIFVPEADTLYRHLTIMPRHKSSRTYEFAAAYFAGGAGSSPMYKGFTEGKASSPTNSITVTKPAGVSAGDLIVAAVVTDGTVTPMLAPPGDWNEIDVSSQSGAVTLGVWWLLAGASEPPDYEFTWGGGGQAAYGWIMLFSGNRQTTPVHSAATNGHNSNSPNCLSVTTSVPNTLILRIGGFDGNDITVDSTGMPDHTDITMDMSHSGSGTCSGGAAYKQQPSAGSSGSAQFSLSASHHGRTITLAIAPPP
ncbi:MAG: prepilin-type N-terminal cleavage/methylation domain-containing protein [Candidatus Zixiibacteriota bacterium]|nr:MAG: prepilin-type N-terminal cleavage/methylation domain-containing protein [candidate division Zixibacteria bacterium]